MTCSKVDDTPHITGKRDLFSIQYYEPAVTTALITPLKKTQFTMRLVTPTDFDILATMTDGRRNNAINIATILDRNRSYINTRLPVLTDYDLLERVGPAPNSGLYVITPKGRAVATHRDRYTDTDVDFDALVADTVAQAPDDAADRPD